MENIKKLITNKTIVSIVFSVLFVLGFNYYFFEDNYFGNESFINLLLLALSIMLINKNSNVKLKDKKIPMIFAFIFSLSITIGKVIFETNDIATMYNFKSLVHSIIILIGFTKVIGEVLFILFEKIKDVSFKSTKSLWKFYNNKYFFIIIWTIIFISWLPAYLSFYPGALTYDSYWQTEQALGNVPYMDLQPPIHTFVWQICLRVCLNSFIDPLCFYSIIQMLFLSFVCTKLIKVLVNKCINNWIILGSILFFAINPAIAVFSFSMTKDIYFAGLLLLFVLQIIDFVDNPESYLKSVKKWIIFCIITVLTCLFRSNAIYAYVLFAIFMMIYLRKYWNKASILLSIPLFLYIIITRGLYPSLLIYKTPTRESLSVPMQQIARVVHYHESELDEKTMTSVKNFIEYDRIVNKYNPRHADHIKSGFNTDYFKSNKMEFVKLWLNLFKKYPSEYMSAFLSLNLPYWYFDASTVDEYAKVPYIETGIYNNEQYTSKQQSVFPKLQEMYMKVTTFEFAKNKPFIANIFSITTSFWLIIFTITILIYKKQYKHILIVMPIFFLWLTHMAGPVSNFRYIFAMFIEYPLLISMMFYYKEDEVK